MKHHVIAVLFFVFPCLYSMELEKLEMVPFLDNKSSLETIKKDVASNDHRLARYEDFPEKVYLVKRIPGLIASKEAQKEIITYMINTDCDISYKLAVDFQRKIHELHNKIDILKLEKNKCPAITINRDKCANTAYGASIGGCCGGTVGFAIEFVAAAINSYAWCCCGVSHSKIIWDSLIWGLPICTCGGCIIGACCVGSGLCDKIRYV